MSSVHGAMLPALLACHAISQTRFMTHNSSLSCSTGLAQSHVFNYTVPAVHLPVLLQQHKFQMADRKLRIRTGDIFCNC